MIELPSQICNETLTREVVLCEWLLVLLVEYPKFQGRFAMELPLLKAISYDWLIALGETLIFQVRCITKVQLLNLNYDPSSSVEMTLTTKLETFTLMKLSKAHNTVRNLNEPRWVDPRRDLRYFGSPRRKQLCHAQGCCHVYECQPVFRIVYGRIIRAHIKIINTYSYSIDFINIYNL
jgi:hypothetical protein